MDDMNSGRARTLSQGALFSVEPRPKKLARALAKKLVFLKVSLEQN
jgi:hypothetical protein